ncbi:MAG: guanine deaminase [Candidatus Omnitrophota bacterium]
MTTGIRGALLDFVADPVAVPDDRSVRFYPDGLLVIRDGQIKALGTYSDLIGQYPGCPVTHYPGRMILPGFIDTHVHYSQLSVMASYGEHLLKWLESYVFPAEARFEEEAYARTVASLFLDELLRNGTTTAAVFATIHAQAVDILFEECRSRNMRMIAGKVMMDRHAPPYLLDTPIQSYDESKRLIRKWHGNARLRVAVTPRFAITSSREQLDAAGQLIREFPDVHVQTHLSETTDETRQTLALFPECRDYLQVYEQSGLVTDRSIFAHAIHLSDSEWDRLSQAGAAVAFCPSSNLFLGSGLFNLEKSRLPIPPVKIGMATDIGAGTSLSLPHTLGEAYKVLKLQGQPLSALQGFYLLTLGGARALALDDRIGNFEPGKEADIVVLNPTATPLLSFRNAGRSLDSIRDLTDQLFTIMCMGDDRVITATYVNGTCSYSTL